MSTRSTPRPDAIDLLALGGPVMDVIVRSAGLPRWDDKQLGRSVRYLSGGSEANAACAASRLGLRAAVFGAVGDGPVSVLLRADLRSAGVCVDHLVEIPGAEPATALVHLAENGERAITFVPGPEGPDRMAEFVALLSRVRCLYTLPYDVQRLSRVSQAARQTGTLVVVDAERAVVERPGALHALLACADILFFNEGGYLQATGERPSLDGAGRLLARSRAQVLVVTCGDRGALAVDVQGQRAAHGAYVAHVVDSTGAGDSFNAGFLSAWLCGAGLAASLSRGCATACLCVETVGARAAHADAHGVEQVRQTRPVTSPGPY